MRLKQRTNGLYYCEAMINGNRYNFTTNTEDLDKARKFSQEVRFNVLKLLDDGVDPDTIKTNLRVGNLSQFVPQLPKPTHSIERSKVVNVNTVRNKSKGMTLEEASARIYDERFKLLKEPKSYSARLKKINEVAKKLLKTNLVYLVDLTPPVITSIRNELLAIKNITPSTVNRYMAHIKTMMNVAYREWSAIEKVPYVKITKEHTGRTRVISQSEEQAMVNYMMTTNKPQYTDIADLFQFLINTGLRLGEALGLTYRENINLQNSDIILTDPDKLKNKKPRCVPLTPRAKNILIKRQAINAIRPFDLNKSTIEKIFKEIKLTLAKIRPNENYDDKELCFHACRHTYASRMIDAGVDLYTIKALLGHQSILTTERYTHLDSSRLRFAVNALLKFSKNI